MTAVLRAFATFECLIHFDGATAQSLDKWGTRLHAKKLVFPEVQPSNAIATPAWEANMNSSRAPTGESSTKLKQRERGRSVALQLAIW